MPVEAGGVSMERLTKRLEDGQVVFHECHGTCGTCDGATCYCIGTMVDRLAAYEDTGMEPGDFKKAFNENAILKLAAQALGTTPDHLRYLVQAENEGRMVVLPCKAGSLIYVGRKPAIITRFFGYVRERYFYAVFCDENKGIDIPFEEIGKTVFLTREKAGLAGKGGDV